MCITILLSRQQDESLMHVMGVSYIARILSLGSTLQL